MRLEEKYRLPNMLIDARTIPANTHIDTEVCIIGAGAAGITLALEFVAQNFRVCLLESGGLENDAETQALAKGDNVGLPYFSLEVARLRFFGGTTNHWGGWCWPFGPIDFEKREWVPYSGWPFNRQHLVPYYERAQTVLQLGPFNYDAGFWQESHRPQIPLQGFRVITSMIQTNALRFGEVYRNTIFQAKNITTYLNANVLEIETSKNAKSATRVAVTSLRKNPFFVSAKLFVLAAGGIENARVLLLSNKVQTGGLGNQNDLVGRFFMDHPKLVTGSFLPSNPYLNPGLYSGDDHSTKKIRVLGALTLSEEVQRQEKILNYSSTLETQYAEQLSANPGIQSIQRLMHGLRQGKLPERFWEHLGNVIFDIDDVGRFFYRRHVDGTPLDKIKLFKLVHHIEQAPNPESRVVLSNEEDALGKKRVKLNWRFTNLEKRTIRRAQEIIAMELGKSGLGRVQITLDNNDGDWVVPKNTSNWDGPQGSFHHMGTTRMHADVKQGVVDADCRVHGVSNLFIAGSSVFPTSSCVNPTSTIVALAVRLADHVKKVMESRA